MTTITIPKKFTNGKELLIVPKKDWEKLWKIAEAKIFQLETGKGLKRALEEVRAGKTIGPFDKVKDLMKNLER